MAIALFDVMAGFTITIKTAQRDVGYTRPPDNRLGLAGVGTDVSTRERSVNERANLFSANAGDCGAWPSRLP